MSDVLQKLPKEQLVLAFEECIAGIRRQTARLGTTMGTSSQAADLADLNRLTKLYATMKSEIIRRMP